MKINLAAIPSVIALLLTVAGCMSVDTSNLNVGNYSIDACANVYVQDQRPYIVSNDKGPDFVGIIRGGYGNPVNFSTGSGAPLASELGKSIQKSLSGGAEKVELITGAVTKTSNAGCKTIVLNMKEWKIDAMVNAWFQVDADMEVYSSAGKLLASKAVKRKDALPGSFFNAVGAARKNFVQESEKSLAELLTGVDSAI